MTNEIITVGIKELKNKLSSFVKHARNGTRVLVTDRDRVVAELREPLDIPQAQLGTVRFIKMSDQHEATPVKRRIKELAQSPLAQPSLSFSTGTAQNLLDADRGK